MYVLFKEQKDVFLLPFFNFEPLPLFSNLMFYSFITAAVFR